MLLLLLVPGSHFETHSESGLRQKRNPKVGIPRHTNIERPVEEESKEKERFQRQEAGQENGFSLTSFPPDSLCLEDFPHLVSAFLSGEV